MVDAAMIPELTEELEFRSMVTDELIVMGTEDMEKFDKLKAEQTSTSKKLIGTHSDGFHCDEVLACAMLLQLSEFENSIIIRTR